MYGGGQSRRKVSIFAAVVVYEDEESQLVSSPMRFPQLDRRAADRV